MSVTLCAVAIGYVQTLSGLRTTPDQVHQRVQHITTAVGQLKVLGQLSEGAPTAGFRAARRRAAVLVNLPHAAVVTWDDTGVTRTAATTTWRRPDDDARMMQLGLS